MIKLWEHDSKRAIKIYNDLMGKGDVATQEVEQAKIWWEKDETSRKINLRQRGYFDRVSQYRWSPNN